MRIRRICLALALAKIVDPQPLIYSIPIPTTMQWLAPFIPQMGSWGICVHLFSNRGDHMFIKPSVSLSPPEFRPCLGSKQQLAIHLLSPGEVVNAFLLYVARDCVSFELLIDFTHHSSVSKAYIGKISVNFLLCSTLSCSSHCRLHYEVEAEVPTQPASSH